MDLDQTIKLLKQKKQPPKQQDESSKLNIVILDNISYILSKGFSKILTSLVSIKNNIFKVKITNFPTVQKVHITNHDTNNVNFTPLITSIESIKKNIQQAQSSNDLSKITNKLEEIKKALSIQKEIKNNITVQNPLSTNKLEKQLDNLIKAVQSIEFPEIKLPTAQKKIEVVGMDELRTAIADLQEIMDVPQNQIVTVSNPGDFPVSLPVPSFRDSNNQITQALLDRQQHIITSEAYMFTDNVSDGNIEYLGNEDAKGNWFIMKVSSFSSEVSKRYASQRNNPLYTNYGDAWSNKTILTYSYPSEVF
jgi:hypothetical protein